MREAAKIVAGAVEGVDHPHLALAALHATFFTENSIFGIGALELFDDYFLRIAINFAGVIHPTLLHYIECFELVDVAEQDVAGEAGGLDHDGYGGFLHGERLP
ncbi:hypothetical protein D3C81_1800540 [compost metagenome]